MRIDAYTRLSRFVPDETSTARQEADCRALAAMKGWDLERVHTDVDFSAYTGKERPGFEALCRRIADGDVDAIIFWKLDRLVRNHGDFERLWALCEDRVQLVSVTEPIDTTTEIGMVVVRLLVSFARLESATISLRVKAQREQSARRGDPPRWTRRAFGLSADWSQLVPEEAEAIRDAYHKFLDGWSAYAVAAHWNDSGLVSPTGKPWRASTVVQCVSAPRIAAQRIHNGEVVAEGNWPAILTPAEFERLQAVLSNPARKTGGGGPARHLLTGLLRCHCGTSMSVRPKPNGTRRYLCRRDIGGCGAGIIADPTEAHVVDLLFDRLDTGTLLEALDEGDDELALIRQDEARLEQLAGDYADGLITRPEWLNARDRLVSRIDANRRKAMRWVPQVEGLTRDEWTRRDTPWRRGILRMVFDRIIVGPSTGSRFDADRIQPVWRV